MGNKEYRIDLAILRLLAIVIVVFFHAYGMTYAKAHLPEDVAAMYRGRYELFNRAYLINIAMPLFTAISGFIFGRQLINGKYGSFWTLVLNKFKRLMIPYLVFSVFFMFTTNGFSFIPFIRCNYWHLWYLPMLFWCFIICYLLKNVLLLRGDLFMLILAFVLSLLVDNFPAIVGIAEIPNYLCWFILGIVICRHETQILEIIAKYHIIWVMIAVYAVLSIFYPTLYGTQSVTGQIASLLAIISLWYISNKIPWKRYRFTKYLLAISACSFGIYIFHNWIEMYMLSTTAKRIFPIVEFAKAHIWLFPFIFSSVAFIISFILSWLLRRTRVGRFLIG